MEIRLEIIWGQCLEGLEYMAWNLDFIIFQEVFEKSDFQLIILVVVGRQQKFVAMI